MCVLGKERQYLTWGIDRGKPSASVSIDLHDSVWSVRVPGGLLHSFLQRITTKPDVSWTVRN